MPAFAIGMVATLSYISNEKMSKKEAALVFLAGSFLVYIMNNPPWGSKKLSSITKEDIK